MSRLSHVCDAACWAYLLRNGEDENTTACDPFAARDAAIAAAMGGQA